ncbi:MAG: RNA polymerase sigma factor [Candidatus Aminicenantes bacterium]|nr:RNA polymerase sigma factor [Candidatus Aminicenantes bacterium]
MASNSILKFKFGLAETGDRMESLKVLSEKEIILAVKNGNKEVYQQIIKCYMQRAYYIALGFVHNHQDALDLSQECFIKAYRKLKMFDAKRPFFPWFYQILKNLCIDHYKKKQRLNEVPLEDIKISGRKREDREMRESLWKGIAELPIEQREVIILRYFRQMSYKEISEVTGKPVGTVMSSLYYAKKKLKGILGKYLGFERN